MKMSLMAKLRALVIDQSSILNAVGTILNRPINTAALLEMGHHLDTEARRTVENLVVGDTRRIRNLRDVAALMPSMAPKIDTQLDYTSVNLVPKGYVTPATPELSQVYMLEMIRLILMTLGDESGLCLDMDALVKQNRFLFKISDRCGLMETLDEQDYIVLDAEASITSGHLFVKRLSCRSEDVDYSFQGYDADNTIEFDLTKIFGHYFDPVFSQYFDELPELLDMGSYKDAFDNVPIPETNENIKFVIHMGVKNNVGQYYAEHYTMRSYEDKRQLLQIEAPDSPYPQRQNTSSSAVIPFMVGMMALQMPEETNYLVQYDPQEKSVVIIPGDPYAEPDPLADVLPESVD